MTQNDVKNQYFEWMVHLVCNEMPEKQKSYRKLLMRLHNIEFRYSLAMDGNREEDGIDLRYRFADVYSIHDIMMYLNFPCTVFEMMVALSHRCEENIMGSPEAWDRTGHWFWGMVKNLGLSSMKDSRFEKRFVDEKIERFLKREYKSNGDGGLFTVKKCKCDLRKVEIWYQMCWYLDGIL